MTLRYLWVPSRIKGPRTAACLEIGLEFLDMKPSSSRGFQVLNPVSVEESPHCTTVTYFPMTNSLIWSEASSRFSYAQSWSWILGFSRISWSNVYDVFLIFFCFCLLCQEPQITLPPAKLLSIVSWLTDRMELGGIHWRNDLYFFRLWNGKAQSCPWQSGAAAIFILHLQSILCKCCSSEMNLVWFWTFQVRYSDFTFSRTRGPSSYILLNTIYL